MLGFVNASMGEWDVALVDAHLSDCQECSRLVAEALHLGADQSRGAAAPLSRCWTFGPGALAGDRYIVQRPLGCGGMGEVYEAFDAAEQRAVALKTPQAQQCDDPEQQRRLASEFALARRVSHRNVCRVLGLGLHRDLRPLDARINFLVMDLVRGEALSVSLRQAPWDVTRVLDLAWQLLSGVAAIHGAGIIHRDIKAPNIIVGEGASPEFKIIDFGLAVDTGRAREPRAACRARRMLEGSPAYMAPEQLESAPVSPATDVFGCGIVLFEALTGALPFRTARPPLRRGGRDPNEAACSVGALVRDVPQQLATFVARCLERDPERRYGSAGAAIADLLRRESAAR